MRDSTRRTESRRFGLPVSPPRPALTEPPPDPMLVSACGMQLHAAVTVDGRDRKRLERLCRYLLRPAFAHEAVQRMPDGRVRVHFKKPNRHGATYTEMSPETFVARLCALVPPPGMHTIRYYGIIASRHALRSRIIPKPDVETPQPKQLHLFLPAGELELPATTEPMLDKQLRDSTPRRLSWMKLLARVFEIDLSVCERCQGPMRVVRAVTAPDDIAAELHGARPPPRPTPRGQLVLLWA